MVQKIELFRIVELESSVMFHKNRCTTGMYNLANHFRKIVFVNLENQRTQEFPE